MSAEMCEGCYGSFESVNDDELCEACEYESEAKLDAITEGIA